MSPTLIERKVAQFCIAMPPRVHQRSLSQAPAARPFPGSICWRGVPALRPALDAIRAFAGIDVEKAVVEPAAVAALSDFDTSVRHYEVIEDVPPAPWSPES